jgi:predicted transcriptional regulator
MKLKAKVMEAEKNVRLSEGLLAKVANAARAENRTPDELLEDAAELYLKNQRWEKLLEFGEQNARNLGLTEEDVSRLIAEARRDQKERGR